MNAAQIALIVAQVVAAVNAEKPAKAKRNYGTVAKRKAYAPVLVAPPVDPRQDRQMKRIASIARGFTAKGIKVTFDKATGKFDNVKPYKLWLSEGLIVKRGQTGVKGFFHISQCEKYDAPLLPKGDGVVVTMLPAQTREHFENAMA